MIWVAIIAGRSAPWVRTRNIWLMHDVNFHFGDRGVLLNWWLARWLARVNVNIAGLATAAVAVNAWLPSATLAEATRNDAVCVSPEAFELPLNDRYQILFKSRLPPARLSDGFGIQYWGDLYTARELAAAPHGMLVVEAARASGAASPDRRESWFSAEDVAHMRRGGQRPVLAYLNVSNIETYRDYWLEAIGQGGTLPIWYAGDTADGQKLAAFWTDEWQRIVAARLDRMLTLGFDGVMLDDVLQYHSWAVGNVRRRVDVVFPGEPTGASGYARAMITLVRKLRSRADVRRCGTAIVVNNGVFIGRDADPDEGADPWATFKAYREAIDGIMIESVMAARQEVALQALEEDYVRFGVPVLGVEFLSFFPNLSRAEVAAEITARTDRLGFSPYLAPDPLFNRLEPPLRRNNK
jgi:uncharacterized protein (TIGR01370 family)